MTHPLDGAYARLERAGKHLEDLEARVDAWAKEHQRRIVADLKTGIEIPPLSSVPIGKITLPRIAPPSIFSILVGEVTYNFRAALDYLIFELALLDSGAEQEKTQFPIFSTPEQFHTRGLAGVSKKHVTALEGMQPYNGGYWLAVLADISNQDKHRKLYGVNRSPIIISAQKPSAEGDNPHHVDMTLDVTIDITFANGGFVIPALHTLKTQVAVMLQTFKSEF